MNKKLLAGLAGLVVSTFSGERVWAGEATPLGEAETVSAWPGHLSYELGYKRMYLGEGDPQGLIGSGTASQLEFAGIDFDIKGADWPVNLAAQTLFAVGGGKFSTEVDLGLRKIFESSPRFQPFIGLGFTAATVTDVYIGSGSGLGGYVEGGMYWNFSKHFHAGFHLAYSYAPADYSAELLFSPEERRINAGGLHALFMIGIHW